MSRRNVKVAIPRTDPDHLIKLAEGVLKQSQDTGADCPLKNEAYMPTLATNVAKAKALRQQAAELKAQGEAKNGEALQLLGLAAGQNLTQDGTILYDVTNARNRLLGSHRGKEKNLEPYGFAVKITESTPGKRAAKTGGAQ